jgi:E3 ubiquitin-protein ligase MARCH6
MEESVCGHFCQTPLRFLTTRFNREPLSHVPIDLIFLHQVLPYTMHYFRPKKVLRKVSTVVWRYLAHDLRLTSYFFGERQPSEERSSKLWFRSFGRQVENDPASVPEGSFRRVPNTDHIALPRDMRATASVHENGEPVDDEARRLIAAQNLEAEKAKRVIKDDYIIVYIPPHFRYRVMYFILRLWVIGAISVGLFVGFPIQLGRYFFKLFIAEEVHDGYSFTVGFYLFWACYNVGKSIDRLDKRRQRRSEVGPRSELPLYVVKRALLWIPNISYMVLFLGIVIPILISFVVDLYIILPIRLALNPRMIPRIRVVDMWSLGIVYVNIILHVYRLQPESRMMTGVQNVFFSHRLLHASLNVLRRS